MAWNPFRKQPEPIKSRKMPVLRIRNYEAAGVNRLTAGWTTTSKHPDEIISENLANLRARSRQQFANNDYMSRFVGLCKSNVVGPKGIILQATSKDGERLDKSANDAIEVAFKQWGMKGVCDVTGMHSFKDIQRLFVGTVIIDGEFLAREVKGGPHGYQLALLDPEFLDITHNRELKNGHRIKFSIEYDSNGKPVYYYIRDDALKTSNYTHNGRRYRRYPASQIIHAFIPERVGQKRGIPAASTAMMRMNMLNGYEDAAITAARVGASKMGFFTSPDGEGYTADDEQADGTLITDAEPGAFEQLPEGVDFTAFNPDYPHQQFPEFVKACLRGISSGLGVSYNTLSNDLEGVNFSSIRAGVLEDREAWMALQEWMVESFMTRVFSGWIGPALMLGVVRLPSGNTLPFDKLEKFTSHTWQPRRWSWVDPLKDTQANVLAIQNGLKSRSEVIRDQGRDPAEVWSELSAENEQLADMLQDSMTIEEETDEVQS